MTLIRPLAVMALVLLTASPAQAGECDGPAWSELPLLLPVSGRGGGRGEARFRAVNLPAGEGRLYAPGTGPGLSFENVAGSNGCLTVKTAGRGNYHWLTSRAIAPGRVVVAATAPYFSNPGSAPRELLAAAKGELEVIPLELPREHGSFRAGEAWPFLVRFQGQPLAGAVVRYEDSVGEKGEWTTGENGVARVTFPGWRDEAAWDGGHGDHGRHGRAPERGFVVAVAHRAGETDYLTAFNHAYSPDGYWHKSVAAGMGFVLLGMAVAAPLCFKKGRPRS